MKKRIENVKKQHKLICVIGETARGKDTFAKILQEKYGLNPVVSYTTRPKRPGEHDGVEHYFISEKKAEKMLKAPETSIAAYTKIGDYEYFSTMDELTKKDIYIIDPEGVISLKNCMYEFDLDIEIAEVYITCPASVARDRAVLRGDDADIFSKRATDEENQFLEYNLSADWDFYYNNSAGIEKLEKFADYVVTTLDLED